MRTFILAGIMTAAVAAPAAAVDINCMFPNEDMSCTHYRSGGDEGYHKPSAKPAPSTWRRISETEDGFIIEYQPAKAWTGPTKNVVSASCSVRPNAPAVFGVCPELGESTPETYRVRQPHYSNSYPLGAVNQKRNPSIDDWNGAFAGGN